MNNGIYGFGGEYGWLSNFHPVEISYDGRIWPTTEHAYQAAKAFIPRDKDTIHKAATPGIAKRLGRKIVVTPYWDLIKKVVMLDLQRLKYKDPELKAKLIATQNLFIEETNHWGDVFWGVCEGEGQNNLGKILMQVRSEIQEK